CFHFIILICFFFFFFSSRRRHTRSLRDWSSDVCSSDLDGNLVQGHIDVVGICLSKKQKNGSWEFEFGFPKKFAELVIEKGSVCVNGISLTAFSVKKKSFKVAIIPYTFNHTNIQEVTPTRAVNIEFDIVGKYIAR